MRKIPNFSSAVIVSVLTGLLCSGCLNIKPTYSKEKVAESIVALSQKEYNLSPKVWLLGETVWIYIPLPHLLVGKIERNSNNELSLEWDKEKLNKINKIMMAASRVLLSMKPRPQFLVVIASETKSEPGVDYAIVTWIPDIVKFQLQLISRDEFARRNLVTYGRNTNAMGDTEGTHIKRVEVRFEDFLSDQLTQRIRNRFLLDKDVKDFVDVKKISVDFKKDTFNIVVDIAQTKTAPGIGTINVVGEIARMVAYVVREYDFKSILAVDIENTATGDKAIFSRVTLLELLRSK